MILRRMNCLSYETSVIITFQVNNPFLYLLKKSKNLWFSDIFWGYRNGNGIFAGNGLIGLSLIFQTKNFLFKCLFWGWIINPFSTNVPLLYPLKTSENRSFSDTFGGNRSKTSIENGLNSDVLQVYFPYTFSKTISRSRLLFVNIRQLHLMF